MQEAPIAFHGVAYGRPKPHHNAELTEVGPGTPCGEFMRRYWQPLTLSARATTTPSQIRILGEDLILFRDRSGRPGLLYPRCAHRGSSLFYGRVEAEGIRCCYHGWLFSVEGECLDQPCEPCGGLHKDRVRQPWYPLQERYGLIWVYMGPPARMPVLPRWDVLEDVPEGQKLLVSHSSLYAGGDDDVEIVPCNWLQEWENVMDPFHIPILHTSFSGVQFVPEMGVMPEVNWEYADAGMRYTAYRKLDDGREMDRVTQALFPHVRIVPNVQLAEGPSSGIGWVVPVDDTSLRLCFVMKVPQDVDRLPRSPNLRPWSQMTPEERQAFPGDWEAQVSQGPITFHSEENLAGSDRGVSMLRRTLGQQIRAVQAGQDPAGTIFDPDHALIRIEAGNFFRKPSQG
ncbi:aromatic ring-hydroxylating dioxygenase subunit alpha [Acidovorax cavernicola]|uniref:Aromatic ring-hydroxylating dioxygenase subunit alpha n=1 Tax=Acidovorax cavernicola TaxID=1675792 RepID=A0A9X8D9S8_9BURK|nr:aromatic ring-hydroxylating dioxygenase subunit alpha [Acidovorax cavernicola]RIX84858.1 aromatic ring-hydroxylating dioxygenase subunit alpha [Acidovorax cavernicola]